jgi:hypothetical protein
MVELKPYVIFGLSRKGEIIHIGYSIEGNTKSINTAITRNGYDCHPFLLKRLGIVDFELAMEAANLFRNRNGLAGGAFVRYQDYNPDAPERITWPGINLEQKPDSDKPLKVCGVRVRRRPVIFTADAV